LKRILWLLFFVVTAAGAPLPFLPAGSWPWWDSVWITIFFVAVYYDLASSLGLSQTRFASGVVVATLAVLLGLSGLTGWPLGPLRFTEHAGFQLGGAVPLLLPLLAFSLLTVSHQAAAAAFPGSGQAPLAAATAGAFLLTLLNGIVFFSLNRLWWEWNSPHLPDATVRAAMGVFFLGIAAFALAFVYPVDTRLKTNRWSPGLVAWLAGNALFLVANGVFLLR